MTPREMEARCLDQYAALTGPRREDVISYYEGLIMGRYGTTSQSGRDHARRVLDAMSGLKAVAEMVVDTATIETDPKLVAAAQTALSKAAKRHMITDIEVAIWPTDEPIAWLKDVGSTDDPCFVPCAKGDPGSFAVFAA